MVRYVAALLSRRYCTISILCIGVKVIALSWSSSVESRSNVFVSDWPSPQLALSNWPLEGSFVSILGNFSEPFFRSQQKVLWCHCERKTNKSSPMLRSFPQWLVVRSLHKEGGRLFSEKFEEANRIPITPVINPSTYFARYAPFVCLLCWI